MKIPLRRIVRSPSVVFDATMTKAELVTAGYDRVTAFCLTNSLPLPPLVVHPKSKWWVDACAFYRPADERERYYGFGIHICLEECARTATAPQFRNWNWPSCSIDRTPYGVVAHELGHHMDWCSGERKWTYGSEYCEKVKGGSGEPPLTGYAPNPAEWFAEHARLFITNPALLALIRPRTYKRLCMDWTPVGDDDWEAEAGPNVPERIRRSQLRKVVRV